MKMKSMWIAAVLAGVCSWAVAGESKPFSQVEFEKLTVAGKPVVLDISAPWCPTCKQQKPVIDALLKKPDYKDVTVMSIDFDSSKTTLKKFNVFSQSTLIGFKGQKEVGRSVGDTAPASIEKLFASAVK